MWVYYVFFWQRISCVFNAPFLRAQWTCSCYPTTKNYVILLLSFVSVFSAPRFLLFLLLSSLSDV